MHNDELHYLYPSQTTITILTCGMT